MVAPSSRETSLPEQEVSTIGCLQKTSTQVCKLIEAPSAQALTFIGFKLEVMKFSSWNLYLRL